MRCLLKAQLYYHVRYYPFHGMWRKKSEKKWKWRKRSHRKRAKRRKAFNGKAINNDHKCQNIRYPSLKLYLFTFHRHTHEVTTIIFHFHPLRQDAPLEGSGVWPQNNKKHYGAKIKCSIAVKGAREQLRNGSPARGSGAQSGVDFGSDEGREMGIGFSKLYSKFF